MGFFQRQAEKSERRTMLLVSGAIGQMTDLDQGWADLPCHILPGEVHHGIWVGERDQTTGNWIGLFRCQMHFWGVVLDPADLDSLKSNHESLVGPLTIRQLQGSYQVTDLGPMATGVHSLAAVLATLDFQHLE